MSVEMEIEVKSCTNVPCKCKAQDGDCCCGEYCKGFDPSEDDRHCGCGHMACDITKELGNENSFASTGS
jgi:hypothetical protein